MKKALIFAFLALPLLAKAEPPTIIRIERKAERLPGIAYDYYYDVLATDSLDNTYRYFLPPTFAGKSGDVVVETSPIDVQVAGKTYVNYMNEYYFKKKNAKNL